MNLVNFDDFAKEQKKRERKEKFRRKVNNMTNWFYNNKELVLFATPIVTGITASTITGIRKNQKQRKEKELKERYCYDPSLGHYWKLRRELTNSEWIEIDRRKRNGERLGDILDELKVLK